MLCIIYGTTTEAITLNEGVFPLQEKHFEHWPKVPKSLTIPETTLYHNLEVSAKRFPKKIAFHYYGGIVTYEQLLHEVDALAAYLQHKLGVRSGEKVMLYMQNSPQYVIAYYAILRSNAVVVPLNPMLTVDELPFYIKDCEMTNGIVGQELYQKVEGLLETTTLNNVIVAAYSDYIDLDFKSDIPSEVRAERKTFLMENHYLWKDVLEANLDPGPLQVTVEDLAVLPYTSGTTGLPKGCMHTHRTVQSNTVGGVYWGNGNPAHVHLMTLPLFHVTGMVNSMHGPIFSGGSMVIMTRWNRETALHLMKNYQCTHWVTISTMLVDFLSTPNLNAKDMESLASISGGGAAFPEALGEKLYRMTGLTFREGYGLSETIAQTHMNPPDRSKMQCLGIPSFDVDARVIDPNSLQELGANEVGEIIVNGPQVMKGYYNRDEENQKSFLELGGKTFFRTGDIGKVDEEGYFFIVDRVKRMINASGFKVWPTEVESFLYKHPAVQQACVVGVPDERRGETVKAFVILNDSDKGKITEEEMIEWAKEKMAAYKYPRFIEFVESLPTTSSGKILWRKLQEQEWNKEKTTNN